MENSLKNSINIENTLFYTSLFFLPSTFFLSVILILLSLLISYKKNKQNYFNDKYNLLIFFGGLALILSSILNFFNNESINNISDDSYLTLIGLSNWIPQIFLFIGCQKYLSNINSRRKCLIALVSGTVPVIFSCLSQLIFSSYGPMKTLFGLVVWYQRPINGITGVTGLFSNPNYLGAWLILILPFCLALIIYENKSIYKMITSIFLSLIVSILILLTASRAAFICLLLPLPLVYGKQIKGWFLGLISVISFLILNLSLPIFGAGFQAFLRKIIPEGIWINFTKLEYLSLDISRINIFSYAIKYIFNQPFLGYGSRSFPTLFFNETNIWKGHAHNLPLELMVSYGIPATLIILIPISFIIFKGFSIIFFSNQTINKNTIIDRAWLVSLLLLAIMHLVDIQYFDGRISITGWILIAGARNILLEDEKAREFESKKT